MYWVNLLHLYQPPYQEKRIIDQIFKESYEKILKVLESNPAAKITLNICASLTEQLARAGYGDFLSRIKELAIKGQVELTGSAGYHALLPLIPKSEIIRQIKLNEEINQKYFGAAWQPQGFFPPEMAYSKKMAKIIKGQGYQWLVLDEIAYQGSFSQVDYTQKYLIKNNCLGKKIKVIFRDRHLSQLFFGPTLDSADKFFSSIKNNHSKDKFLVTAFDGENLGHHQKGLTEVWENILKRFRTNNLTYSEYLAKTFKKQKINPLASTWATEKQDLKDKNFYPLWSHPQNKIHQYQWQITNLVLKEFKDFPADANNQEIRSILDQALASDQYWWASQRPWWSPGLIKRGLKLFFKILELDKGKIKLQTKEKIKQLGQKILQELEN